MRLLIIIIVASALVCCSTLSAQKNAKKVAISGIVVDGQKKERKFFVSGIVTDADRNPVEGAEIFIDSAGTGNFTDNLGKFKIRVKPEAKRIFIYSAGHGYCEAEIIRESTQNLSLKKISRPPPDFIAKNSGNNNSGQAAAKKMNTYTDIYQMIRHEVSGVVVSGKSVVVQGPNSFFGSSQPLFVVNGVRLNNIDYINPVEVKSIRLLKGSNANIYGTEGANGVIVIDLQGSGKNTNIK